MRLKELLEGRTDAIDLTSLARRHFGPSVKVSKGADQTTVTPDNINMSSMSGFMAEVKRIGLSAKWDQTQKSFLIQ